MKTVYILIGLLICSAANGQHYNRFLNNSAWIVEVADIGGYGPDRWFYCSKDTVIGNKSYTIIQNNELGLILLREDTLTKKVFFLKNSIEYILYDFDLDIGNSTIVYPFMSPDNALVFNVTGIDSVLLDNGYHKRTWLKQPRQYGAQIEYVEGIGVMSNPFIVLNILSDPTYWVRCKYDDQKSIYHKDTSCKGNPFLHSASVNRKEKETFVKAYPNPGNGVVYLTAPYDFTLSIFDNSGRELFKLQNPSEISLMPGIYQFIYFSGSSQSAEKIIVY